MRFYTKKRRTPMITIVSLIDILAILLIFFIVTTTFRKQEPALEIKLPESSTAQETTGKKEPIVLDVKSLDAITLDNQKVSLENLTAELRKITEANPQRPVNMRADQEVPFGVVVKVTDALRVAGVKNVQTSTRSVPKP